MISKRIDNVEPNASESLASLVTELHTLKGDVRDFNRTQRTRFYIIVAFFVAVAIFGIGNFIVNQNVQRVAAQIADCIQTTGKCYQSGTRRAGGAAKFIADETKRNVIAANWCSGKNLATLALYETCVDDTLKELAKN